MEQADTKCVRSTKRWLKTFNNKFSHRMLHTLSLLYINFDWPVALGWDPFVFCFFVFFLILKCKFKFIDFKKIKFKFIEFEKNEIQIQIYWLWKNEIQTYQ